VADAPSKVVRVALWGLATNIALAAAKLVAGLVGHSYALVADAIESMADIVGSVVIWAGLKYAGRPADEDHPYGHGRAESLAALAVAGLVFAAGLGIATKAVDEIVTPHHAPEPWTLIVLIVVVIIKSSLAVVARRTARLAGSTAGHVDAGHHNTDALTSLAAFLGISIAVFGGEGFEPADDIAALVASGIIIWNAYKLARPPLDELLDRSPDDIIARALVHAAEVEGVVNVQKATARKLGAVYLMEMHVRVEPLMTVYDAHALSHRVKDHVRARLPSVRDVLIHIEPSCPPPVARPDRSDAAGAPAA
jgi:cation diffusion facilitator family transporter